MKQKNFRKNKQFFSKKPFNKGHKEAKILAGSISQLTGESIGHVYSLSGIIDRIVQTGGPTVFYLSDGTGVLALKSFEGPGIRSHPEINENDIISVLVKIGEFQNELEGEIIKIEKLQDARKHQILQQLREIEKKRAHVEPPSFLIQSPILQKLKPAFIKAATEIRLAIIQNRPIIVRHHNDTDGYSSGFSLEKAILPLIEEQHGAAGKAAWEFYTRAPCAAPFYEIDDSIRDTAHSLSDVAKFSNKMPLVIIADNGSSPEDLLGILQGKVHGMDFIVVDHHYFDKDVISNEVLVHINPFLVGEDGAKFSAGMLCTEFARFINPKVENIEQIPAMACLADRINNPDALSDYLKIAESKGYSKQLLNDISAVIDFVSAKLRFMEAREYIEVLFGEPMDRQKSLVKLLAPYIRNLEAKGLSLAKSSTELEKIGETTLQLLDIKPSFPIGFYPKPGKCTGLVHDDIQEKIKLKNVVTLGILDDAITIRATDEANFSVHNLIQFLNEKMPGAFVEGGGHKNAGTIKFVPKMQSSVLEKVKEFVKKMQK